MNKMKLALLAVLLCVFGWLVFQRSSMSDKPSSQLTDSLQRRIVELEGKVEYHAQREKQFLESSGAAKERVAELEFMLSKKEPVVVTVKPKTNTNEKVVPVSVTASEYYNSILSKRYENY